MNVGLVFKEQHHNHIHDMPFCSGAGQVSMLGLSDGSGTRCAGGSGITTADSTVRSGRTWTSSPDASIRQPCSPSSSSDATTTDGSVCSARACTDEVALRACSPVAASPVPGGLPVVAGVPASAGVFGAGALLAPPGTGDPGTGLHARSTTSSVHAAELHVRPSVVVASEELDGEHGWRMLASGELLHVRPDLTVESAVVLPEPPAHLVPLPASNPNIDT